MSGVVKSSGTFIKVEATFQCSKNRCRRSWTSAHAWEREESIDCEGCGTKANILNVVDEMMTLDIYRCPREICKDVWESIHDGRNSPQECYCGIKVKPEGVQERFGRHYFLGCPKPVCALEWEDVDVSTEPQMTQRCLRCHSRGDIVKVQQVKPPPIWLRQLQKDVTARLKKFGKTNYGGDDDKGKHNAEFCDMCCAIQDQDLGENCLNFTRITLIGARCREDGTKSEDVVSSKCTHNKK